MAQAAADRPVGCSFRSEASYATVFRQNRGARVRIGIFTTTPEWFPRLWFCELAHTRFRPAKMVSSDCSGRAPLLFFGVGHQVFPFWIPIPDELVIDRVPKKVGDVRLELFYGWSVE